MTDNTKIKITDWTKLVLSTILAGAVTWGVLKEKVSRLEKDIDKNKTEYREDMKEFKGEVMASLNRMDSKLDTILFNGRRP